MKKTAKKKVTKSKETIVSKENLESKVVETTQESTTNNSQVSDKNVSCDCCETEEIFDFVRVRVKGNEYSVSSLGFTKEQEKAIAMTMFQMKNRFGLETDFTVNVRKG